MTPRPVPPTVLRARQLNRRFAVGIILISLIVPFVSIIAPLILLRSHELVVLTIGMVVTMGLILSPMLLWRKRLLEIQRVMRVWAKIEAEEADARMERQLRLESAAVRLPPRQRVW